MHLGQKKKKAEWVMSKITFSASNVDYQIYEHIVEDSCNVKKIELWGLYKGKWITIFSQAR